jgi:hypothetical protein
MVRIPIFTPKMKQPISDEELVVLIMRFLLGLVVVDDFPALETSRIAASNDASTRFLYWH